MSLNVNVLNRMQGYPLRVKIDDEIHYGPGGSQVVQSTPSQEWFSGDLSLQCEPGQVLTLELREQPSLSLNASIDIDSPQHYIALVTQVRPYKEWTIEFKVPVIKPGGDTEVNVTVGEDEGTSPQLLMRFAAVALAAFTIAWLLSPLVKRADPGLWIAVSVITGIGALITGFLGWWKKKSKK